MRTKTAFETLIHAARVLERTAELEVFDDLSPAQLLSIVEACWRCEYDVFPDQLSNKQIACIIADPTYTPRFAEGRRGLEPAE